MSKQPESGQPVRIPWGELGDRLSGICSESGIDVAGAVPLPCELPNGGRFLDWLQGGRHAGLEYLLRDPDNRLSPQVRNPWARSVLVFAQRYTEGWPPGDPDPVAGGQGNGRGVWTKRVSRYARGQDYHRVLLDAMKEVLAKLTGFYPALQAKASTDTGPYLEREYAWLAGLGFLGKNTCLIHERLGSGIFLGVALTNIEIEGRIPGDGPQAEPLYSLEPRRIRPPAQGYLSACGTCTRCIEACPTQAIAAEGGLDARRCISTWTIEWKGRTPEDARAQQGEIMFGCDICQAVCPWNQRAAARPASGAVSPAYAELVEHADLNLADLINLDAGEFRRRFRETPIWRCHPEGLRRNALQAAWAMGDPALHEAATEAASDHDQEIAALARLTADRLASRRKKQ